MDISVDMHIHTPASCCCTAPGQTPALVADRLAARGFRLIAFTDHVWCNPDLPPSPWYARHDGTALRATLRTIRSGRFPLKVLASCEADMQGPGRYGITEELVEQLDFVTLATDHFQLDDFVEQPVPRTPKALAELMLSFFDDAVRWGRAQVFAHPLFANGHLDLYDAAMETVGDSRLLDSLGAAAQRGIALEINVGVLNEAASGRFHRETVERIFSLAKEAGCRFTIGSDAHNAEHFDHYDRAEDFTARIGITEADLHPLACVEEVVR